MRWGWLDRQQLKQAYVAAGFVSAVLMAAPAAVVAQTTRTFAVTPSGRDYSYVIPADGFVTWPSLVIENVGTEPIAGISLSVDGRDLSTIDAILASILREGMTDEQRARAIWEFGRTSAYAWFPYSDFAPESNDPVRFFGSYGYGLCSDFSAALAGLYVRAGFRVRIWAVGLPSGHVVPEVFFDDGWHVMDANRDVLFLERDGRTIAGMETLIADPWLIDRAGDAFADLRPLYESTPLGAYTEITSVPESSLALTLRPGERFEYLASSVEGAYRHDTLVPYEAPTYFGNAVLTTAPVAGVHDLAQVFEPGHGLKVESAGGVSWWAPDAPDAPAKYVVATNHPVVRASLTVDARLPSAEARVSVYAASGEAGVGFTQADLAAGTFAESPFVVSYDGLATIEDDGLFPVLHVGPSGRGDLVLRLERPDQDQPLVVGGTFFRFTSDDSIAIAVSTDGSTWSQAWAATSGEVDYFEASTDASALVGDAETVYVRYTFEVRSAGGWAAGAVGLHVGGVAPAPILVGTLIANGDANEVFDLSDIVAPTRGPATYGYVLRFTFEHGAGLRSFSTTSTMQIAPGLFPAPRRGTSSIVVRTEAGDPTRLRLRHGWTEIDASRPRAPERPLVPAIGERLALADTMTFSWVPSSQFAAGDLQQYEVEVCADASCGSPLTSLAVQQTAPPQPGPDGRVGTPDDEYGINTNPTINWALAEWLSPGRTYYWRVRTMSRYGEWSDYGESWSFVAGDRVDATLALRVDGAGGTLQASSPTYALSGEVSNTSGPVRVRWTTGAGRSGEVSATGPWRLTGVPLAGGDNEITIVAIATDGRTTATTVQVHVPYFTYLLAEGSTQADFSTEVAIANPASVDAPIAIYLMLDTGATYEITHVVSARSRLTVRPEDYVGSGKAFAIEVRSLDALPLAVERTMRWGPDGASGHGGSAVTAPSRTWYFAEGSQGYFDTFVLLANPNEQPTLVNIAFMTEGGQLVSYATTVAPRARETVWARQFSALMNTSFSISVNSSLPVVAERAIYFGQPTWKGGHVSTGAAELASRWFCPEGATGPYLDTYILVGNPSHSTAAPITVKYLTGTGDTITEHLTVAPHTRVTLEVESRSPLLADAAVSTVVDSTAPIVVERATYWGGTFTQWHDGTASLGTTTGGARWVVADVRTGGRDAFETWVLLTNENPGAIEVDLTVLPESGAPTTMRVTVPARSRYNFYVNAERPDLDGQSVGVLLEAVNGEAFAVERAQYWSVNGVTWSGGSSSRATLLP